MRRTLNRLNFGKADHNRGFPRGKNRTVFSQANPGYKEPFYLFKRLHTASKRMMMPIIGTIHFRRDTPALSLFCQYRQSRLPSLR